MKSEEIMIGDEVLRDFNAHSGYEFDNRVDYRPYKIRDGDDIDYACESNREETDDVYKPIFITPEILENHGFSHNISLHNSFKEIGNYHVNIQFGTSNKVEYVHIQEIAVDRFVPSKQTDLYLTHIQYFHELQHAIRLCGIITEQCETHLDIARKYYKKSQFEYVRALQALMLNRGFDKSCVSKFRLRRGVICYNNECVEGNLSIDSALNMTKDHIIDYLLHFTEDERTIEELKNMKG